jgi:hypothetical protein
METIHYKNASTFVTGLRKSSKRWNRPHEWGFRGQCNASWELLPTLLRGEKGKERWRAFCDDHHFHTIAAIFKAELFVMQAFINEADQNGLPVPSYYMEEFWKQTKRTEQDFARSTNQEKMRERLLSLSNEEINANIGIAQHYGCPTRLLDWTWKPFVAAYFAAKGACEMYIANKVKPQPENLAVFGLNTFLLRSMQEDILGQSIPEISIVHAPQASNPNLAAQAGFFVLDRLADGSPLEKRIEALSKATKGIGIQETILYKLTLPISEAPKLLRILYYEGVSAATIFPGYSGVAEALWEAGLWDKTYHRMQRRWQKYNK